MVFLSPSFNLIFGLQLDVFLSIDKFGYSLLISSFLNGITPNLGYPPPTNSQIFKINFFTFIGFPDPTFIILAVFLFFKIFIKISIKSSIYKKSLNWFQRNNQIFY